MSDWKPISEAPKDGTFILAYQPGVAAPDIVVVSFDEYWSQDGWWMCCDGKNPELPLRGPEPTHWQPLPPPPAPDQRKGVGDE